MRSNPGWLAWIALTAIWCKTGPAQEPSPTLKQADTAYRAGQAAFDRHNLAEAQSFFEQVIRLDPQAEQGHAALGVVLLSRGQAREAIPQLEAALARKKMDTTVQMNLAIAYQQTGTPEKAIPLFSSLVTNARLQKHPLPAGVLASFARSLAATGDLDQAVFRMKAAVHAEPLNAELHDELGSLFAQQRHWPVAEAEFVTATRLAPSMAMAHLHLGLVMGAQEENRSTEELESAAQLAPDNDLIGVELGKAYAAAGRNNQALTQLQRVLDRNPGSTPAQTVTAYTLQRMGRVQEAIALLRMVVATGPPDKTALTNLGLALMQTQDAKDAVPVLQQSIAADPKDAVAREDLAAAYIELNQLEDAVGELRRALEMSPEAPQLHYDLGLALKMQDHPAEAVKEFERTEALDAANPEAPYALGLLYLQMARYPEAARELKRSLELRPENGDGWATLGSVYNKLDMLPEATNALREASRQLPDQADPHLTLATVLTKQHRAEEALEERKKAADLMRVTMNRERAEFSYKAGEGLFSKGDLPGAAEQFRDALRLNGDSAEAHFALAKVLDAEGKSIEAALERERARALQKTGPS